MTLDIIIRRVNYQGDDRTTCFPFPFKVWGEEQVVVYCSDPATPWTETNITNLTTVELNDDNYGGAVIFKDPPVSGLNLAIVREGSFLQEDEYISGSRFDAHEVEDRFDEDAAERQELLDATARSIKVPNSSTMTPEEVYQLLVEGAIFIQNSLEALTKLYESAVYYYELAIGILGSLTYTATQETTFTVEQTHSETEWVYKFNDGFSYYPQTHQLLVMVDGVVLTPQVHYSDIGNYGETSQEIRFYINLYQGQQVYVKALFLGTEEFDVKVQEMNIMIETARDEFNRLLEDANKELTDKIDEFEGYAEGKIDEFEELAEGKIDEFEELADGKIDEFKELVEDETKQLNNTFDRYDEQLEALENLVKEAYDLLGSQDSFSSFQDAIKELNDLYSCFNSINSPTQGYCTLSQEYRCGCCLSLPGNVCYYSTDTVHLVIDGLILSPKYYERINNGGSASCCVRLRDIYLHCDQELYAWTVPNLKT